MFIFLYARETWTITADIERRIQALEMRCFRKLLGISNRDHITNEEVKTRIGNAIGPNEDLLTWPRLSYREQFKDGDEEADRGNDGKTASKSGLALNGIYHYGKPRTARS